MEKRESDSDKLMDVLKVKTIMIISMISGLIRGR